VHIPDSFLSAPVCVGAYCLAGAGLALASRRVTEAWNDRTVPLVGVMSAFVFAGQMVNFPVAGGTSGHLLGGMLAAVLLGPHAAALVLATVLTIQCLFFQDGGITTLGANLLNLALVGVYTGYGVFRWVSRWLPGARGGSAGIAAGAWVSVVAASGVCAVELAASGTAPLRLVLPAMLVTHALIGVGEAVITLAVVSVVQQVRPDLVYRPGVTTPLPARAFLLPGLAASLGVAVLLGPLASSLPDGLEGVAGRLAFAEHDGARLPAPLADYQLPGVASPALSNVLAAVIGTVLSLLVAWGVARLLARWIRRPSGGKTF
jgi:cobalt/nickel transport system permease protein